MRYAISCAKSWDYVKMTYATNSSEMEIDLKGAQTPCGPRLGIYKCERKLKCNLKKRAKLKEKC